jgi:DNA repair/transcription protein MET18/MMS19
MMPFLLRGIDSPDVEMRTNNIETLISVAEEESGRPLLPVTSTTEANSTSKMADLDVITEHATTIITHLLKNIDWKIVPNAVSWLSIILWFAGAPF